MDERAAIVFVDDELANLESLTGSLEERFPDFQILTCANAYEALKTTLDLDKRGQSVSLFISDQIMPEMNGVELLTKISETHPQAKKILLTAYASKAGAIDAINQAGVDRYIEKQTLYQSNEPLFHAVEKLLEEHADLQATYRALQDAQELIVEQEKIITEQSMAGGFAHEVRNALSPINAYLAVLLGSSVRPGILSAQEEQIDVAVGDGVTIAQRLADVIDRGEDISTREASLRQIVQDLQGLTEGFRQTSKAVRERLNKIGDQAAYALDLTEIILDYARIESQKGDQPVDLRSVVEQVLAAHADQLRAEGVICSISAEGNPIVSANPTHIRQVLENLLRNAWQAMAKSETKQLRIAWEEQADPPAIRVRIEDTGAGIPPELRDKVFLPFFTTNPSKQGAGLGLPISRRIARLYSGDLTFASKPGQTVFTLTLPTQRDG